MPIIIKYKMDKKRQKNSEGGRQEVKKEVDEVVSDPSDDDEEERPVPKRLVALFIFLLCVYVLVAGYF